MVKRGEIYWVDWGGQGSEQSGPRPSLIIQNDIGNDLSPNTIVASLTTAVNKPYPFIVAITQEESGLKRDSSVDLASIATISKSRLREKCGQLKPAKMTEVNTALKVSLDID